VFILLPSHVSKVTYLPQEILVRDKMVGWCFRH